jgi:hypothetical protein
VGVESVRFGTAWLGMLCVLWAGTLYISWAGHVWSLGKCPSCLQVMQMIGQSHLPGVLCRSASLHLDGWSVARWLPPQMWQQKASLGSLQCVPRWPSLWQRGHWISGSFASHFLKVTSFLNIAKCDLAIRPVSELSGSRNAKEMLECLPWIICWGLS